MKPGRKPLHIVRTDRSGEETHYIGIQAAADANYVDYSSMSRYINGKMKPGGELTGVKFKKCFKVPPAADGEIKS